MGPSPGTRTDDEDIICILRRVNHSYHQIPVLTCPDNFAPTLKRHNLSKGIRLINWNANRINSRAHRIKHAAWATKFKMEIKQSHPVLMPFFPLDYISNTAASKRSGFYLQNFRWFHYWPLLIWIFVISRYQIFRMSKRMVNLIVTGRHCLMKENTLNLLIHRCEVNKTEDTS
jgi:hypothetical protein